MVNRENEDSKFNKVAIIGIIAVLLLAALFVVSVPKPLDYTPKQLAMFSSNQEIVDYFAKAGSYNDYYRGGIMDMVVAPMMANATGAAEKSASSGGSATNFSTTNIQVEGVDEADIIKNDGKYVYAIANNKLYIVDAYPAEDAKIIATFDLNENLSPTELFIEGDKLLLFSSENSYNNVYYSGTGEAVKRASFSMPYRPYYYGSGSVTVQLFNISDKTDPTLQKEISFDGSYLTSRLIGKNAYFVINSYPSYNDSNDIIPMMRVNGVESKIAAPTEIGMLPRVRPQSFVTIASINVDTQELSKETVVGSANSVYASENNIYFSEPYWDYSDYDGPVPLEVGMLVKSVYAPNWAQTQKTAISKFHLDSGKVSFVGQGIVPGSILNQFSMDEYKDNFRIATTVENYYSQMVGGVASQRSSNNLYVLDKDMNLSGSIEDIAPDEKIYSVRFMGERGYMVTFKYVDPLFVFDLSDATNPKIMGKLKIPGYSDYLHPIDETHLLGIGKDANELEDAEKVHSQGAVYYTAIKGVKMAIFDVSDISNPKELSNYVIGDRGTDSEALTNHKSILFDKEKQLLVLPITIVENKTGTSDYYGQEQSFQGAIVMNVSLENGLSERGRITHVSAEEELKRGYYYGSDSVVRRSLFMDDYLYTFSDKMLKANNLSTLAPISEVLFPVANTVQIGPSPMID